MADLSRSDRARRIARCIARREFRGRWDLETLMNDAESVAFELEATAPPDVKATAIGFLAAKRVKIGRQFRQSIRSITTGKADRRSKRPHFQQVDLDLNEIADVGTPPSLSVPGWMDYQVWIRRLGAKRRKIANALSMGESTSSVARMAGVSDGRISQMRREFMLDWNKFQGEEN